MDADMHVNLIRRLALVIILMAGCNSTPQNTPAPPPNIVRGTQETPKRLAINVPPSMPPTQSYGDDERTLLIPPPPPKLNNDSPSPTAQVAENREAEPAIQRVSGNTA